jgi:hypothetical protein
MVLLAVMWVAVLVPPLLRSRSENRPSSSVGSFRRQLATLGRTTPGSRPGLGRMTPARSALPYYAPRPVGGLRPVAGRNPARPLAASASRGYRAAARRRRQQVLLFLVAAVFVTGVAAFGMGLRSFLVVNLIADALLIGYCYVLVQVRRAQEAQRASAYRWSNAA